MKIKPLYEALSVTGQIKLADLKQIAEAGIKTVINNRPDGEALFQPRSDRLAERAQELGMSYHYIPVISGAMTDNNVREFASTLKNSQGPVLAFCRTGTRSTTLWAKSQKGRLSADAIIKQAAKADYDLSALKSDLTTVADEDHDN